MPSFLTPSEKAALEQQITNIHETFARPLFIFKLANETVITENPEHSYVFDAGPTQSVTTQVIQSGMFSGRILYEKKQPIGLFESLRGGSRGTDQVYMGRDEGLVRLKLDPTGSAFMADATRVRFDDTIFQIDTSPRPHGLFNPKWTTFYLKRLQ